MGISQLLRIEPGLKAQTFEQTLKEHWMVEHPRIIVICCSYKRIIGTILPTTQNQGHRVLLLNLKLLNSTEK